MAISNDEVIAIARLAHIGIEDNDIPGYSVQLSKILEFVAQMDTVDTTGVQPLAHPLDLEPRWRADEVTEINRRDDYQRGAPRVKDGFYLVPKVIK